MRSGGVGAGFYHAICVPVQAIGHTPRGAASTYNRPVSAPSVELLAVRKSYGRFRAVDDLSLTVPGGAF